MKRLGLFVFYDKDGILDDYVEMILCGISLRCHKLITVINGNIQPQSLETIKKFTNNIIFRENIGYDAGAYKDVLLSFSVSQRIEFDEIVFFNDTFYGPLCNMDDIWEKFDQEKLDFWGLTRHPKGWFNDSKSFQSHIQSYFFVVKKSMLQEEVFWTFWKKLPYPESSRMAIEQFEIEFTTYFEKHGFTGKAWTDIKPQSFIINENENPYIYHSYELVKEMQVPFLKRKCLALESPGYANTLKLLEYINRELDYDICLIWDNIFRLCQEHSFSSAFNYCNLEEFYHAHDRIYIYGAGRWGKNIGHYFRYRNWKLAGMIDTYNESYKKIEDIEFGSQDGIIIALSKKFFYEVLDIVREKAPDAQLLIPEFDES